VLPALRQETCDLQAGIHRTHDGIGGRGGDRVPPRQPGTADGLSVAGRESSTTIAGGAWQMWVQGEKIAALLIAFFAVIAPALQIGFLLAILLAVRRPPAPRWVGTLLRWVEIAGSWSMVEVMMLGILVSLVKIAALARVVPGVGIFAVGGLILLLAAMSSSFDPREAWSRVRWANGEEPQRALPSAGKNAAEAGR